MAQRYLWIQVKILLWIFSYQPEMPVSRVVESMYTLVGITIINKLKMRGSVVSLSFIFPHPPEDKKKKKLSGRLAVSCCVVCYLPIIGRLPS